MIPVNKPLLAKNTLKYVSECIRTGWVSSAGKYISRFEEEFAGFLGVRHAVTTTSGTTALHLALVSAGIGCGDDVIIPDLTMIAVPYAVLYTGANPIPVDVDPEIFAIDPQQVRKFIITHCEYDRSTGSLVNSRTHNIVRAIIPVHLYGHPCPMEEILSLAREFNLTVIEDAAEAHGALYYTGTNRRRAEYAGSIGDAGCFSFYANKIITTGEGGIVVTDNDKIAARARRLKDLAHSPKKRFLHTDLAFNYRMTNLQAAVGLAQLQEVERFIAIKRRMAEMYRELLSGVEGLILPCEKAWARSVYWMYAVLVEKDFGLSRDAFMESLRRMGIDTRTFFIPVHRQPVFKEKEMGSSRDFPVSRALSLKGMYLPSGLALTEREIRAVCRSVKEIKKSTSRKHHGKG